MEIKKIDPKEFNLEQKDVQDIDRAFLAKVSEKDGYLQVYGTIIKKEISPDLCSEAGELRKKLVKVRTGIASIHKTQKAFFLAAGRYVDAWKNKETEPIVQMEENLRAIEEHYERIEQQKIDALYQERKKLLAPFSMEAIPDNLGKMNDHDWGIFFGGAKYSFEEKQKEEAARKLKEQEEAQEKERLRRENEKLLKEKQKREREEQQRREAEERKIQEELAKGDKDRLQDLIYDLKELKMKYSFESDKNQKVYAGVRQLLDKIVNYINENSN